MSTAVGFTSPSIDEIKTLTTICCSAVERGILDIRTAQNLKTVEDDHDTIVNATHARVNSQSYSLLYGEVRTEGLVALGS